MATFLYNRRWEVYHGQVAECGSPWNTYENPRSPKNLSFENVRFVVTDEIIANLEPTSNETTESSSYLEALTILSHFLSPGRTGVWDELAAMIKTKILEVDEHGIPALTKDWWTRVDILFLSEMNERCGFFADPKGVYGIVDTVRTTLSRKWIQCDTGWALTADTDDIIYDFEEFDEWRAAFNEKKNARSDRVDGIGKFR